MGNWLTLGCSVIGASHVRRGKPNQDAIAIHSDDKITVIAVSDGHGSDNYFRSEIGSRIAVNAIVRMVEKSEILSGSMRGDLIENNIRHMKSRYLMLWQDGVDKHLEENPLEGKDEKNSRRPYGCTILAAIVYKDLGLIMQYGDGDVIGVTDDYSTDLMEEDSRNFGNATLSMTSLTEASLIHHKILRVEEIPDMIMLSSDGVKNSYDDRGDAIKQFYKIPLQLKDMLAKNEKDEVLTMLEKALNNITSNGSGDDVTIGFMAKVGHEGDVSL